MKTVIPTAEDVLRETTSRVIDARRMRKDCYVGWPSLRQRAWDLTAPRTPAVYVLNDDEAPAPQDLVGGSVNVR